MYQFSYCFINLLSKSYITIQPGFLSCSWRNCLSACHHGKRVFKNVAMFPILYYEYDGNTTCHKAFIMTHPLVYRLKQLYQLHQGIMNQSYGCFFIINAGTIIPANKYEFLFHIVFSFFTPSVMYITLIVFCIIQDNIDVDTDR